MDVRLRFVSDDLQERGSACLLLSVLVLGGGLHAARAQGQGLTVAAGVPLRVTVTHSAAMRVGAPVEGVLTSPVWVYDRLVLPEGALVSGTVMALEPVPREDRLKALLNGDVTPLHRAVVNFAEVRSGNLDITLVTEAHMRQVQSVRFVAKGKVSILARVTGAFRQRWDGLRESVGAPDKRDRALHLLYNQLPYHPQRVWPGSEYVAELSRPVNVPLPAEPAAPLVEDADIAGSIPSGTTVRARLVTALDSDTSHKGEVVTAVVTQPVLDGQKRMVLPEGSELQGLVTNAQPSRSFGRTGLLRFSFRSMRRQGDIAEQVHGTLTGAEGSKRENLSVDEEGTVKAQPAPNRFAAPLLLAVLAQRGHDDDSDVGQQVVAANGLGLVARVVALTVDSRNVATGFGMYALAKSVYFRFLARGSAVAFPRDTAVQVQLADR